MRICLDSVKKTYQAGSGRIDAVRNVSLVVPSDTVYGIIGKSGAGKSTLMRLISLLEKPDSGSVLYDGVRVDNLDKKSLIERRRRIGMIFQNFNLFSSRTAGENIAYPLEIVGRSKHEIKKRTAELLELVGLEGREKAPVSTLSGGQKQRVAIARAMAIEPEIMLFDEPTSSLDPELVKYVLGVIRRLADCRQTMIVVTHEMKFAQEVSDRVVFMDGGRILEEGSPDEIFERPRHGRVREFLDLVRKD